MKATLENLKKCLEVCAKAHRCELSDYTAEDGAFGLNVCNVSTVSDVRSIIGAFGGDRDDVETDDSWDFTIIYTEFLNPERDVNKSKMMFALPYGSLESLGDSAKPTKKQITKKKIKDADCSEANVIRAISVSCGISPKEAKQELKAQVKYLRELAEDDDLRYEDVENACYDLGIEPDFMEYFLDRLAYLPTFSDGSSDGSLSGDFMKMSRGLLGF